MCRIVRIRLGNDLILVLAGDCLQSGYLTRVETVIVDDDISMFETVHQLGKILGAVIVSGGHGQGTVDTRSRRIGEPITGLAEREMLDSLAWKLFHLAAGRVVLREGRRRGRRCFRRRSSWFGGAQFKVIEFEHSLLALVHGDDERDPSCPDVRILHLRDVLIVDKERQTRAFGDYRQPVRFMRMNCCRACGRNNCCPLLVVSYREIEFSVVVDDKVIIVAAAVPAKNQAEPTVGIPAQLLRLDGQVKVA